MRKVRFKILVLAICVLTAGLLLAGFSVTATNEERSEAEAAQEQFKSFINSLWANDGVTHANMVVFPITLKEEGDNTQYLSLDEAIENGFVKITEVGSGSVPTLRLEVKSTKPMFFMGGEIVTGAKQDRILSHDLVFRGYTGSVDLPVYCVEQGRWTHTSDKFGSGKTIGSNEVRKAAVMKEGQSRVWAEVSSQNAKLAAETSTGTMQASYDSAAFKVNSTEYMEKFIDVPAMHGGRVVGVVIAIDGKVKSADVFCNPQTFRKLWSKVLKAAVMEAISSGKGTLSENTPAREFLGSVLKATLSKQPNPSMGEEYALSGEDINGGFIKTEDGVVHLALFSGKLKKKEPVKIQLQDERQQIQQIPPQYQRR